MKDKGYIRVGDIRLKKTDGFDEIKNEDFIIVGRFLYVGKKRALKLKPFEAMDAQYKVRAFV